MFIIIFGPIRRVGLKVTHIMWTPYLPVRDRTCLRATNRQAQTGTRRTSSHEPRNRNRDAAWRLISALFGPKRRLSANLGLAPPCVHSRYTSQQRHRPPQSSCHQHDVPSLPLTHKAKSPIFRPSETEFLSPIFCNMSEQFPGFLRSADTPRNLPGMRQGWEHSKSSRSWLSLHPG